MVLLETWKLRNSTIVTEFVLSGLSSDPNLQLPLFLLCLSVYLLTIFGNFMIIVLIKMTPALKTPMYFFLMNLSFVDIFYSSTITPNFMANIISVNKTISISGCATQMFFFIDLASSEAMLLAVMAYDRYVAICKPLYYTTFINQSACFQLIFSVYTAGFLNSLTHTYCAFILPFCHSNVINHFFCDVNPILKLSCRDTFINELLLFIIAGSIEVGSFLCIIISYSYILGAVCRTGSSKNWIKSLSTCASHFSCVALFYCPVFYMYLRPTSAYSVNEDWVVSVFYTVIVPLLNPIIYSMRNQDVKEALKKKIINSVLMYMD
ncbi:PREDICTED: olfactory receptor 1019-like [Nanorana parkeri]|uniref:olfactory receptor 1019-like n=1 Tax=Nanorana parkeri TaxID=125878 RepID=UPI000854E00D|nr:PREDICTED: olfactory receptor 1019-like [Nanorana parkeri]